MTLYISNRDGNGKTDEKGHYKFPSLAFTGGVVLPGLAVTQNSPLAMSVVVSEGDFRIETSLDYAYTGWSSSPTVLSINTADAANPRIDTVVVYVDKTEPTSPSPPNNPGIAKFMVIPGLPSPIPAAPSGTTIQSAIGANNPYILLADVRVNAGATSISNSNITDLRTRVTVGNNFVTESSILNGAVTTNKLGDGAVTGTKIANNTITAANLLSGAAIKPGDIRLFSANKTSSQTAPTNGAQTLITWNGVDEYNNSGAFSASGFTAPVNGWLWTNVSLVIVNGDGSDDSINWGFYVNGTAKLRTTDNWRFFSRSGVEAPTSLTGAIYLNAGDKVTVQFVGTTFAVAILGSSINATYWSGLFIPSY